MAVSAHNHHRTDVAIVGGGIAGLAAARRLHEAGVGATILEARDRLGGRIWTTTLEGAPAELGATWIHRIDGNPIATLARQAGLSLRPTDYDNATLYGPDGRELADARQTAIDDLYERTMDAVDQRRDRDASADNRSLQDGIDEAARRLDARERRDLAYAVTVNIEHDYAIDAAGLSLREWDQDGEFGGPDVLIPGGYRAVVDRLAAGLPVLYGRVEAIRWSGPIEIAVALPDANRAVLVAERAIVSVPLGVLKVGEPRFDPPLPAAHQAAIGRVGVGLLDRLVLRFPRVFWDEEYDLFGWQAAEPGLWAEWYNLTAANGQPTLVAFNAGSVAARVATWGDDSIVASAMDVLRTIFGRGIPAPTATLLTRWGADPFSRGSYSHLPPGASGADYDALARPASDRLFFAGEHTSRRFPGTVHGALLSGQRAADEVLAALGRMR
ncbi:MAG: FAD-dependent oxidoreductase [Dehalococcoidia bacterium]